MAADRIRSINSGFHINIVDFALCMSAYFY